MTHIVAVSGSLRHKSFNTALLRVAAELVPEGTTLELATIEKIPLYNGDVEERQGIPEPVASLKERIAVAGGLLISTPEYNHSLPGVLKNALDWLSRPPADIDRVFARRPVAVIGASTGDFGTTLAQNAWLPVVRTLRMRPWFDGRLTVPRAAAMFDAAGQLTNESVRSQLGQFIHGFAAFARSSGSHS